MKYKSGLTRYVITYKSHIYPKRPHEPPRHKSYNKKNDLGRNWEDEGGLLGKTVTTATTNSISVKSARNMSRKEFFVSKSLSALREEWFSSHALPTGTPISNEKY